MIKSKFMIEKIIAELVICETDACTMYLQRERSKRPKSGCSRGTTDRKDRYWSMLPRGTVWCRNHGNTEFKNNG